MGISKFGISLEKEKISNFFKLIFDFIFFKTFEISFIFFLQEFSLVKMLSRLILNISECLPMAVAKHLTKKPEGKKIKISGEESEIVPIIPEQAKGRRCQ